MFSSGHEPLIAQYLQEKIKEWQQLQNCLLLLPNEARFEKLLIFEDLLDMSLNLFQEKRWRWTATVPMRQGSPKERDEIYDKLKAYEINLVMEGFFRNKPRFVAGTNAQDSDKLVSVLENDRILIWLVKKVRPDSLSIVPDLDPADGKLSWLITLSKGPVENTMLRKSFIQRMYAIIERTSNSSAQFAQYLKDEL